MKPLMQTLLAALVYAALLPAATAAADPLDANIVITRQVDPRSAIRAEPHPGDKPYVGPVTSQVNASPARDVLNATGEMDDSLLGATRGSPQTGNMLYSTPGQSAPGLGPSATQSISGGGRGSGGIAGAIQQGLSPLNHLPGM